MPDEWIESWLFRLLQNLLGYASVGVPAAILIHYLKNARCLDAPSNRFLGFVKLLVRGQQEECDAPAPAPPPARAGFRRAATVAVCFAGLQASYLTWGVLQEKIMTREYGEGGGRFRDSQFLVFVNRVLAFLLAGVYVLATRQPRHAAPLYKYSYCSLSNVVSSWLQYEALKYVSFPTQVLAKASKIIPVMLMGRLLERRSYRCHEYATAAAISAGTALFLLEGRKPADVATPTTASGVAILLAYVASDSFTSNWQGALFSQYRMSSAQMMCGVNLFSCILTSASLWQQGSFARALAFALAFPRFLWDCALLSACSALGQFFIFYTIAQFGPVAFVVIMTVRQVLAILLSCLLYGHALTPGRGLGVAIVFSALFLRIYLNHAKRAAPPQPRPSPPSDQQQLV